MAKYYIRPIPLCRGPRDKSQWLYRMNCGETVDSCNYAWYIEGSEPKILVDTGAKAEMYQAHGLSEEDIQSLEEGLSKLELKPEQIDIVILTHLHWDHVALASKLTRAKFIVQKAELEFAQNPHPATAPEYDANLFKDLNFEVIEGDREIIEGVKVFLTPGHTPGGQSVGVETLKGLAVITGFCCSLENFSPPPVFKAKGLTVVAPGIHTNALQAYDSVLKVKQIADIVLPLHDAAFMNKDRIP